MYVYHPKFNDYHPVLSKLPITSRSRRSISSPLPWFPFDPSSPSPSPFLLPLSINPNQKWLQQHQQHFVSLNHHPHHHLLLLLPNRNLISLFPSNPTPFYLFPNTLNSKSLQNPLMSPKKTNQFWIQFHNHHQNPNPISHSNPYSKQTSSTNAG